MIFYKRCIMFIDYSYNLSNFNSALKKNYNYNLSNNIKFYAQEKFYLLMHYYVVHHFFYIKLCQNMTYV